MFPPHTGTGGAKRLGNRRPARRPGMRGRGTTGHEVIAATRTTRQSTAAALATGRTAGYPGQGQQGYAPQDGQYGSPYGQQPYEQSYEQPYEQQPYEQYGGYGPEPGQGGRGRLRRPAGLRAAQTTTVTSAARTRPLGMTARYGQGGYDQRPAPGYGPGGDYQDPNGGYGQPAGYPAPPAGGGGYSAPPAARVTRRCLPAARAATRQQDAGNDWYGGQPAAAKGASFADTGTYALNGRVIDEYGTGPRGALRDPVRGYPPGRDSRGAARCPFPPTRHIRPAGLPAFRPAVGRGNQAAGAVRRDQGIPGVRQERAWRPPGRAASGGFQGAASGDFQGTGEAPARPTDRGEYGDDDYQVRLQRARHG